MEASDDSLGQWWKGKYSLADYHQRLTHVRDVRTAVVQDAGHMLHHDQPQAVAGWKGWQAAGAKRVYWRPNNLHSGYRDAALSPRARENSATLQYLANSGMLTTDMDSLYHNWATQGLHYYMMAKLSWNPKQDYDALLSDYCQSGFGAGAEQVRQYFLLAEKGVVLTPGKPATACSKAITSSFWEHRASL